MTLPHFGHTVFSEARIFSRFTFFREGTRRFSEAPTEHGLFSSQKKLRGEPPVGPIGAFLFLDMIIGIATWRAIYQLRAVFRPPKTSASTRHSAGPIFFATRLRAVPHEDRGFSLEAILRSPCKCKHMVVNLIGGIRWWLTKSTSVRPKCPCTICVPLPTVNTKTE
jgi:hypothetical protein